MFHMFAYYKKLKGEIKSIIKVQKNIKNNQAGLPWWHSD